MVLTLGPVREESAFAIGECRQDKQMGCADLCYKYHALHSCRPHVATQQAGVMLMKLLWRGGSQKGATKHPRIKCVTDQDCPKQNELHRDSKTGLTVVAHTPISCANQLHASIKHHRRVNRQVNCRSRNPRCMHSFGCKPHQRQQHQLHQQRMLKRRQIRGGAAHSLEAVLGSTTRIVSHSHSWT